MWKLVTVFLLFVANASKLNATTEFPPLFSGLVNILLEGINYTNHQTRDELYGSGEYDFIVVGAGSAGAVVASRLSEVSPMPVFHKISIMFFAVKAPYFRI